VQGVVNIYDFFFGYFIYFYFMFAGGRPNMKIKLRLGVPEGVRR
jgi:hypothetical protein